MVNETNLTFQDSNFCYFLGKVDLEEMIVAFKELGISMEREEAFKLFNRMDQDGSLFISFNEWRDFLVRYSIHFAYSTKYF